VSGHSLPEIPGTGTNSNFDYSFVVPGRYTLVVSSDCFYACYKNEEANVFLNFFPGMKYWYFSAVLNQPPFLLFGEQKVLHHEGYSTYPPASMYGVMNANWQTTNGAVAHLHIKCAGLDSLVQEQLEQNVSLALKNPLTLLHPRHHYTVRWKTPDCKAVLLRQRNSSNLPCMFKYVYLDKDLSKNSYAVMRPQFATRPVYYYKPQSGATSTKWFLYFNRATNPEDRAWVVSQKIGSGPFCVTGHSLKGADSADSVKYKATWPHSSALTDFLDGVVQKQAIGDGGGGVQEQAIGDGAGDGGVQEQAIGDGDGDGGVQEQAISGAPVSAGSAHDLGNVGDLSVRAEKAAKRTHNLGNVGDLSILGEQTAKQLTDIDKVSQSKAITTACNSVCFLLVHAEC
jgi:hypothetical protein